MLRGDVGMVFSPGLKDGHNDVIIPLKAHNITELQLFALNLEFDFGRMVDESIKGTGDDHGLKPLSLVS
jgi:hypothetical protein